ncbi:type 2 lanthipeptide synthetase LanM family protein [Paenibacillus lentus]|uniref:Type 2 lantipeptide synthetase LanM n=1 Tax=Paenibacillus lentus TaxID=1338368 RepID=A0A3S8RX78_9BACL|nr:type 2 lanthipeptide synthetase LanM family protein [Paenibacillus lentus]AZK47307.1 type 2 lantipeptide synthetase LanM [Paenibacillus lentus]
MSIENILKKSTWSDAMYLHEKYKYIDQHNPAVNHQNDTRIKMWKDRFGNDEELLNHRITAEGMDYDSFKTIINSGNLDCGYTHFEWYKELVNIFLNQSEFKVSDYIKINKEEVPFLEFSMPFLKRTIAVIHEGLKDEASWIGKKRIIGVVLLLVMDKVFHLSVKTLIYELNNCRLNNELQGEDPTQRYQDFVNQKISTSEKILKLLLEYPVLARVLVENMMKINKNILIVLQRLIKDRQEIEDFFDLKLGNLNDISFLGDSHNGGACVLHLKFENNVNVIYKPRNLAVDVGFTQLLGWFNNKQLDQKFKTVRTLNKDEYGWQEYVPYIECANQDEVSSFFQRQGQYMAILYAINATDMHMENIITHGEHPFFVDLESLFHNQPYVHIEEKDEYSAFEKTAYILNDSILKTNMLPALDSNFLYHSDLSGLAGDIEQILNTYEISNKNTDLMKITRSKITVKKHNHLPMYMDEVINPKNYLHSVKKGFINCYQLILEHKHEFINYLEELFKGCLVRTIIRPTITYFTLLEASTNPKYLKNGIDRVFLFDFMWMILKHDDQRKDSIQYECSDLLYGDIPLFKTVIGEKYLLHHKNDQKIMNVFTKDILSLTQSKILRMCEEDIEVQWEFVERTVRTKYLLEETYAVEKSKSVVDVERIKGNLNSTYSKEDFLREAIRIGEYIKDIAIYGDDGCTVSWISMGMDMDEKLIYKATELGLYNGVTGIAYFYMYLGKETGNPAFIDMTNLCINTALEMIKKNVDKNISVFTGYGSLLFLLMHKANLFNDDKAVKEGHELLGILEGLIDEDKHLDIISGCAGTMITCIDFYKLFRDEKALSVAIQCGEHILAKARTTSDGLAWVTSAINKIPLSGIAHGNSGICLALARLYEVTGDDRYLKASQSGIKYEDTMYDPEENNWKDLRFVEGTHPDDQYALYWCNGAPGIGIARIGISKIYESDLIRSGIKHAIEKTMSEGFTEVSYSLCHGDLGNLELIMLGEKYYEETYLEEFRTLMSNHIMGMAEKDNFHWKCGIPGRQQIPGLMLGLSGIGYQLLRLYNNQLPSVLMLEGPAAPSFRSVEGAGVEYNNV